MSDSKKTRGHFLDDSRSKGKQNEKDLNQGRKFDWRNSFESFEEENQENIEDSYDFNNKSGDKIV